MLRRIAKLFQPRSLASLYAEDLEAARRSLREATLCSEAWEAACVLARSRIERLEAELQCASTSNSKAASLDDGPQGEWESHFAALAAGSNGLGYGDLSRTFGSKATRAETAGQGYAPSLPAASSQRPTFLRNLNGKKL